MEAFNQYGNQTCIVLVDNGDGTSRINYAPLNLYAGSDPEYKKINIYPASDFLPKNKSKLKRLEKELLTVKEEIRIIKKELNFFDSCNSMSTVDEKPFVLPEKWAVSIKDKNRKEICDWFNEKSVVYKRLSDYNETDYEFLVYPDYIECHISQDVPTGYTEITTQQFIEHVLKADTVKLETGKWYKDLENPLSIFHVCETYPNNTMLAYGFCMKGWWMETSLNTTKGGFSPAPPEEVSAALIAEAERRGFKEGVEFMLEGVKASLKIGKKGFGYDSFMNQLYCNETAQCIFENGIWGVLMEKPKEIDFSIAGQLVENENGYIVLTTGIHGREVFNGTQLNTKGCEYVGYQSNSFDKTDFKLSEKSITLSNGK